MRHLIVYQEPGMFCGLPANNGIWNWGNEILVGFSKGVFKENKVKPPSMDRSLPQTSAVARSLDGGETWSYEEPENYGAGFSGKREAAEQDTARLKTLTGTGVDFAHPDFAMRCSGPLFRVSHDRGRTWRGPYSFPNFGLDRLTSRTEYLVNDRHDCLVFLSARDRSIDVQCGLPDRAFCARTTDGGQTFTFLAWMAPGLTTPRAVMPSTVRLSDNKLVSTMRRRLDSERNGSVWKECWIDAYQSQDNGASWQFLSKVADTDDPAHHFNGSPPSLVRLHDGRLCVTYGFRAPPFGIRARISPDEGRSWGDEIILRDDGRTFDIGYPRSVVREDGQVVTTYYFATQTDYEQHVAATIWDPGDARAVRATD